MCAPLAKPFSSFLRLPLVLPRFGSRVSPVRTEQETAKTMSQDATTYAARIEKLRRQVAQAQARLDAVEARANTAERKARTRRLVLLGAMIEAAGPEVVAHALAKFGHLVVRRQDRAALGLPEAPAP